MSNFLDLTGKKFGMLTAISRITGKSVKTRWEVLCECGRASTAVVNQLTSGKTKSCGCLRSMASKKTWDRAREKRSLEERARDRIERMSIPEPNCGCWLWLGSQDKKGYGRTSLGKGRYLSASRLSFIAYKYDPGSLVVMHTCDNPCCVNPDHLHAGTQKENVSDCFNKGRGRPRGVSFPARI